MKRCVDEVERRGLDIIGIYRLCGADTKKNILRQAFEESPEIVDLTSENVPDINVITGERERAREGATWFGRHTFTLFHSHSGHLHRISLVRESKKGRHVV